MRFRGQGAFEYILLLAGVLLVVVLAIVILRGGVLATANNQIAGSLNAFMGVSDACQALSTLVIHPTGANAHAVPGGLAQRHPRFGLLCAPAVQWLRGLAGQHVVLL
jgi:hypothetical protein